MSQMYTLLQNQEREPFQRPKSINELKGQFAQKRKNTKVERTKVDQSKIAAVLARQNADKKKAAEEEARKKKVLLEKRMEADGGRYAKKIQANQKATVKIKVDRSGVDVNKEKAAPSSKRLREEYNSEKLTKDLKASSSSKSDRKRKSKGADSDRKGSSQKKSRQDPKTNSRPPKPDAMTLLRMHEMGIPTNSHTSDRISKSSSDSSKSKSISSKKEYPPDPDYKTWKLDEKELRWYLENLKRVGKFKLKVEEAMEAGKEPPTITSFFDSYEQKMINKIKIKKKEAKKMAKRLKQKETLDNQRKQNDKSKFKNSKPSKPELTNTAPKAINPYLRKEMKNGKSLKVPPPVEKPKSSSSSSSKTSSVSKNSSSSKEKKKSSKEKYKQQTVVVASSKTTVNLGRERERIDPYQDGPVPDGMARTPWGQLYDPRYGMPPPPSGVHAGRRHSDVYSDEYSDEEDDEDLDDFIDDDTEPIVDSRVATSVLRKITKYDPTKYNDRMMSDAALERSMRAGYNDIDSEEKRALRMARLEDKLEAKRKGTHAFDSLDTSDEDDD